MKMTIVGIFAALTMLLAGCSTMDATTRPAAAAPATMEACCQKTCTHKENCHKKGCMHHGKSTCSKKHHACNK